MKVVLIAAALALSAGVASAADETELAKKSTCMSCHQVEKKVVGPALKDIAKKYKGDAKAADHLVHVIKNGGKGVWGPIPMAAQKQVSDENAKKLADWILSL
ncbi:MAG: c-type cytochrome [Betaproteobacteria bacterium]|nr:c-type cytochrome [Betaproteobacteria bacterium]